MELERKARIFIFLIIMLMIPIKNTLAISSDSNTLNLFLDEYSIELCPYTTKMITGFVENNGNQNVEVKLYSNSKWITIAQDSFVLSPHEKKYINIFITPTDEARVGEYRAKIYAYTTQEEDVEEITINILDCNEISLDIEDTTIDACIGDHLKIPFYIKNEGKVTEYVTLSVDKGKLDFYETVLDSYESDKNFLFYKVTKDYDVITLKATSKNSFANAEKKIYINGRNCYNFDITVIPQSVDICMKDYAVFDIYLRNTGEEEDTIHLKASSGILSKNVITLEPEEEYIVKLKVKPNKTGESAVKIEAWDSVNYQFRDIQITGKRCSNNAMIIVPESMDVCRGSAARYIIGIRNLGEVDESLEITSNIGEFDESEVEIEPGTTVYREIYINTDDMDYGTHEIKINLTKNERVIDSITATLNVKNCYNGEIYTHYKIVKACKFTPSRPIDVIVKNTGEKEETYTLKGMLGSFNVQRIKLSPGEEIVVKYRVNISQDIAEGIVEDILSLKGDHMNKEKTIKLDVEVLKENMCSNFSVKIEPERIYAQEYKGYIYRIKIKNNGYAENTFTVKLDDDYGIIYIEPKKITIDSGEEGVIFLYVAPHSKLPNKVYEIKGKVIDKFNNEKNFMALLDLNVEKTYFIEGAQEDKIITKVKNLDKEKTYYVSKDNATTLEIEYIMEGRKEKEEILFVGGSFIIQIGDELYEDKNPEIGKRTYILKANNKTYRITIKFVYVDNANSEYKFKIEDITIEKERKQLYPPIETEKKKEVLWKNWRILIPIFVLFIGIALICYDLIFARWSSRKKENKKKRSTKKEAKKKEIEKLKKIIEK